MSRIKIDMPSEHCADLTFCFTPYQLIKFRSNVIGARSKTINSRIDKKYFQFSNSGILLFKEKSFTGPSYGIVIDGLIDLIDKRFDEFHKQI